MCFMPKSVSDRNLKAQSSRVRATSIFALNFLGKVVARVIIECHIGTFAGKNLAQRSSDPTRSARDERTFTF